MTEAEWLACRDPDEMIASLGLRVNDRKLRLFQIGCCRRIWELLPSNTHRDAVEIAEQYADKQVSDKKRVEAQKRIAAPRNRASLIEINAGGAVYEALAKTVARRRPFLGCAMVFGRVADKAARGKKGIYQKAYQAEEATETELLRCVFGNPRRRVALKSKWKTGDVIALAQQMYESREFSAMPILADALQDAGCDDTGILAHCRGSGPHVRGCWVVDLILGKK